MKKVRFSGRGLVLLTLILALTACGEEKLATTQPVAKATATALPPNTKVSVSQEDEIREAVFRYQFENNDSGQRQTAHVYCLSFSDSPYTDPGEAFMKRFADHQPPVKKASECSVSMEKGVLDKASGQTGLVFRISAIKMLNETTADVEGGYEEASASASGNTYRVVRENNHWVVKSNQLHWIA